MDTAPPSPVNSFAESVTGTAGGIVIASPIVSVGWLINCDGVDASIPLTFKPNIGVATAATTTTTLNDIHPPQKKKRKHSTIQYRRTFIKEPFKYPKLRALTPDSDECT